MIVRTRGGGQVELRASSLADFGIPAAGAGSTAGVSVSSTSAAGIPAVTAAVRVASNAVASLCLGVWRGEDDDARRVKNVWQARLFAGEPNDQQDVFQFKATIEESLSYRGNAFIWKNIDPSTGRVVELYALHPDQIDPLVFAGGGRRYNVLVQPGFVDPLKRGWGSWVVDTRTILHIRGFGDGGMWFAPNPVQRFRTAIGSALAKVEHEANMFARGAAINLAITYPETMTSAKAREWRDLFQQTHEGVRGAKTAVFGGGATIQPIGLTQADAQFIESSRFSIEDIARMFDVPASLIGGGEKKGDAPITPEHEATRWLRYGLNPRLMRIESAMRADPDLFGSASSVYPRFDSDDIVRGDVATEEAVAHARIQDGRLMVDEWRAARGLPPLPGGVGSIPQIVPVGGGANPVATSPDPAPTPTP